MDRTNAERQRRYIAKLKAAAAGTAPAQASVTNGDAASEIADLNCQGTRAAQTHTEKVPLRTITVKRPGVAPHGPDEISWEQWQALGCEVSRLKEFLRQRSEAKING